MTTLHFKQDVQTTLNRCHRKPNIYLIYNYTSPKIGIKNIFKKRGHNGKYKQNVSIYQ